MTTKKPLKKIDNNYLCMEIIGRGATADVYLTIDDKHNQIVAVKSIAKDKLIREQGDHGVTNLRRELEILHKLKHKNIIGIKNYKETKNNHYIILEYCNGGDLDSYCKKYIEKNKHPLNEFYIQKILQQFVPALEYMHKNKIIHRDIKLQNVLLNFDNYPNVPKNGNLPPKLTFDDKSLNKAFTIKIADLGYAKDLAKDNEGSTILGSPMYMSPDIVEKYTDEGKDNKKYNTSVDLWSLGVITYELLTGTTPFLGKNYDEVFKNIKKGIYNLPKKLKPSIEIISLLNGLLQYYPEKRLKWEQIISHPFLNKNPNEFNYIDLEMITETEGNKIEIDSKNSDNLLWIFFKCKNLNMNIDKMNAKEVQKPEVKKAIDKNKVINEEVKKALEQEKIELEKEKEKIRQMKAKAEEEKKKAELEKINRKKELEKLIKDEDNLKNIQEKLKKETEKSKINSEENNKKLKELENQLKKIQKDKDNEENKLKSVEKQISENEKIKKFTEKQINKIISEDKGNANNDNYKKELDKLHAEKIAKENEMNKLKEEQKQKENNYKEENDKLQKKMNEISDQKKQLEKEVSQNNTAIQEKIKNTNEQMENLQNEIKKIEDEKEKQIKNIQNEKDNLQKQITEFSRIITETEKKEKERQEKEKERLEKEKEEAKKGIFKSCIEIDLADVEKMENDIKEKEKDEELDEWEEIGEEDLVSDNENDDVDIEEIIKEYEIVEDYVDNETAKNEGK
jgi:serine/threonine protein kinase